MCTSSLQYPNPSLCHFRRLIGNLLPLFRRKVQTHFIGRRWRTSRSLVHRLSTSPFTAHKNRRYQGRQPLLSLALTSGPSFRAVLLIVSGLSLCTFSSITLTLPSLVFTTSVHLFLFSPALLLAFGASPSDCTSSTTHSLLFAPACHNLYPATHCSLSRFGTLTETLSPSSSTTYLSCITGLQNLSSFPSFLRPDPPSIRSLCSRLISRTSTTSLIHLPFKFSTID